MARDSGAVFVVSPMFDLPLTTAFVNSELLSMVGCFSPSEVFHAHQMGVDIIKVFPGRLAGPSYIKDLRGPFPDIPFMPTGGVDQDNVATKIYLSEKKFMTLNTNIIRELLK